MDRSFFHFLRDHVFDRRTDRRTEFLSLDHVCSAVKIQQNAQYNCGRVRLINVVTKRGAEVVADDVDCVGDPDSI